MQQDVFETIARETAENGPQGAAEALIERLKADKNYAAVFEARLMLARYDLGLPLIPDDSLNTLAGETRAAYEKAQIETAREVLKEKTPDHQISVRVQVVVHGCRVTIVRDGVEFAQSIHYSD